MFLNPKLYKKLSGDVKDVIIGPASILYLMQNGDVYAWGKDTSGMLGLGNGVASDDAPIKLEGFGSPVVNFTKGSAHVLALTSSGEVFAWGANNYGQIGCGRDGVKGNAWSPVRVPIKEKVVQVAAIRNTSYAVTHDGKVYSWGSNDNYLLGHGEKMDESILGYEPKCVDSFSAFKVNSNDVNTEDLVVRRIDVQQGVVIAYVDNGPVGVPGFDISYSVMELESVDTGVEPTEQESSICAGVTKMRQTIENLKKYQKGNEKLKHGCPYPYNEGITLKSEIVGSSIEEDLEASLQQLEEAAAQLTKSVQAVDEEIMMLKKQQGTRNVRFLLTLYLDDCLLRREKVTRTIHTRKLRECKKNADADAAKMLASFERSGYDVIQRINALNAYLMTTRKKISSQDYSDVVTKEMQQSVIQALECRMERNDFQMELERLNAESEFPNKMLDTITPSLRLLKERWACLKQFSLYQMFQRYERRKVDFQNDKEFLRYLVSQSDQKIDQVCGIDEDQIIARDHQIPNLCYDLFLENAELRKMANAYQLRVLMLHKQNQLA